MCLEIVFALFRAEQFADLADGLPQVLDGSGADFFEMGLELGEGQLDGIEIGRIRRQEQEPGAARPDGLFGLVALVGGEVGRGINL